MSANKFRTANSPNLQANKLFHDFDGEYKFRGFVDETIRFVEGFDLNDPSVWARFVQQFKGQEDTGGWKCEYWGKMMRGACFVYSYTKNQELYNVLKDAIIGIFDSRDTLGRVSSYPVDIEFTSWDMWGRKYILLGMQYFLEICPEDDFVEEIVDFMCQQADYIIEHVGSKEEGKLDITEDTSRHWRGLNSSSILEPIVRLYNITGDKKYFDFAQYIVDRGGMSIVNIFDLAYENKLCPYQYPMTKAYEMTSCFEGLIEFYRVTKNERYKTALVNFAKRILETDFTVIGCSGCTHELFDHSTVRQANTNIEEVMQETCVTVTLMKFFYQLTMITGDTSFVDAFEISLYNAYFGAINTEYCLNPELLVRWPQAIPKPLPYDSYSPLTAGRRGVAVGGQQIMSDNYYYGCCACIGSLGAGLAPKMAYMKSEKGIAVNLYIDGTAKLTTPEGNKLLLNLETAYPKTGDIKITVDVECDEEFDIMLRNPAWSKTTKVSINGTDTAVNDGYIVLSRKWAYGDVVELSLDMRTQAIYPIPYGSQLLLNNILYGYNYMLPTMDYEDELAKYNISLRRGPIALALENRLGRSVDEPTPILVNDEGYVDVVIPEEETAPYKHIVEVDVPLTDGGFAKLTDYSSAGKTWTDESKMAVWIKTK